VWSNQLEYVQELVARGACARRTEDWLCFERRYSERKPGEKLDAIHISLRITAAAVRRRRQ
jgi:hypothetical protein